MPKGMVTISRQQITPARTYPKASQMPPKISQMTFRIAFMVSIFLHCARWVHGRPSPTPTVPLPERGRALFYVDGSATTSQGCQLVAAAIV
ncbi:hypothetical protein GCM10009582_22740 [Arthrobacter flavus]